MADTTYIVLYSGADGWESLGKAEGTSARSAVKNRLATVDLPPAGTYVAVPARSWKPVTVEAVQTTTLKLT